MKNALAPGGTWMIVEPIAGDDTAANLNPVGRIYYSASLMCCVPTSLSQDVGLGLGAQAGEKRLRDAGPTRGGDAFQHGAGSARVTNAGVAFLDGKATPIASTLLTAGPSPKKKSRGVSATFKDSEGNRFVLSSR
jgi:hypothetical protein